MGDGESGRDGGYYTVGGVRRSSMGGVQMSSMGGVERSSRVGVERSSMAREREREVIYGGEVDVGCLYREQNNSHLTAQYTPSPTPTPTTTSSNIHHHTTPLQLSEQNESDRNHPYHLQYGLI